MSFLAQYREAQVNTEKGPEGPSISQYGVLSTDKRLTGGVDGTAPTSGVTVGRRKQKKQGMGDRDERGVDVGVCVFSDFEWFWLSVHRAQSTEHERYLPACIPGRCMGYRLASFLFLFSWV